MTSFLQTILVYYYLIILFFGVLRPISASMDVICEFWSPIKEIWLLERCEPDPWYWSEEFILWQMSILEDLTM